MEFKPNPKTVNEKAGLAVMGLSYANIALKSTKDGLKITYTICPDADKGKPETETIIAAVDSPVIFLRVKVSKGASCQFSYSKDGITFMNAGQGFVAQPGRWIGAKTGLFCTREGQTNDSGHASFDWFRVEK